MIAAVALAREGELVSPPYTALWLVTLPIGSLKRQLLMLICLCDSVRAQQMRLLPVLRHPSLGAPHRRLHRQALHLNPTRLIVLPSHPHSLTFCWKRRRRRGLVQCLKLAVITSTTVTHAVSLSLLTVRLF